jgi:hypothetical protein
VTPTLAAELIQRVAADAVAAGTLRCGLAFPDEIGDPGERYDEWIRVSVVGLDPRTPTHGARGGRVVQQRGALFVQAFVSRSIVDGAGRSRALCQAARDLYQGATINDSDPNPDPITFGAANVAPVPGPSPWSMHSASIPFTYLETL